MLHSNLLFFIHSFHLFSSYIYFFFLLFVVYNSFPPEIWVTTKHHKASILWLRMKTKESLYPSSGNGMSMILPQLKDSLLYSTKPEMRRKLLQEDQGELHLSENMIHTRMTINPPPRKNGFALNLLKQG